MTHEQQLRWRIKWVTWFFIGGLFLSGATAIPLVTELNLLVKWFGAEGEVADASGEAAKDLLDDGSRGRSPHRVELERWLARVRESLVETQARHPFLFYGTDWLAFGHFMIALAFVGVLRDPVRNRWLFDFGLMACVLVIPFALGFGGVRGIPFWWRLIDCSFGVFGFIPLWWGRKWALELEARAVKKQ